MRVLVDTNLLFYALNQDAPEHARATAYLEKLWASGDRWCLAWTNIYELLKLLTHQSILPAPLTARDAYAAVEAILEHPTLELLIETPAHHRALRETIASVSGVRGAFFHDCRIAALMREHDVKTIATSDTDFRKFATLKVIDPLRD